MSRKAKLPGVLGQIAEAVGEDAACAIAEAYGGTTQFVAINPRPDSPLAKIVGVEKARKIAVKVGYGYLDIPMGSARGIAARRQRVSELLREGLSTRQVALACDVHENTVRRIHSKMRRQAREGAV